MQSQTLSAPVAERSPEGQSLDMHTKPESKYTIETGPQTTTSGVDIPSASAPSLSGSLPSTSSIASSASSSSELMPMPPLDLSLDWELELPLPTVGSNWDNLDLNTGMGKNSDTGFGMWPLDQSGFCGLDDMSAFPGQNTQFWVGEL